MMAQQYTPEQVKEIQERVDKANAMLQELQLAAVANISPFMLPKEIGSENVFAFRLTPLFADLKYKDQPATPPVEEAKVEEKPAKKSKKTEE